MGGFAGFGWEAGPFSCAFCPCWVALPLLLCLGWDSAGCQPLGIALCLLNLHAGVIAMPSLAPVAGEDKGQGFLLLSSLLWKGMGLSRPILQGRVLVPP